MTLEELLPYFGRPRQLIWTLAGYRAPYQVKAYLSGTSPWGVGLVNTREWDGEWIGDEFFKGLRTVQLQHILKIEDPHETRREVHLDASL